MIIKPKESHTCLLSIFLYKNCTSNNRLARSKYKNYFATTALAY